VKIAALLHDPRISFQERRFALWRKLVPKSKPGFIAGGKREKLPLNWPVKLVKSLALL
jgi:hypothetical protein